MFKFKEQDLMRRKLSQTAMKAIIRMLESRYMFQWVGFVMIPRIRKVSTVMPFFTSKRLRNVGQREATVINQKLTVSWLHVNE